MFTKGLEDKERFGRSSLVDHEILMKADERYRCQLLREIAKKSAASVPAMHPVLQAQRNRDKYHLNDLPVESQDQQSSATPQVLGLRQATIQSYLAQARAAQRTLLEKRQALLDVDKDLAAKGEDSDA
ncbi:hypothetical protein OSTOST_00515 [Ostertagia ostertagi]